MSQPHFARPVSEYMTRDVETAGVDTEVEALAQRMHALRISGVPIVADDRLVGVVTRTDLIQLGVMQTGAGRRRADL